MSMTTSQFHEQGQTRDTDTPAGVANGAPDVRFPLRNVKRNNNNVRNGNGNGNPRMNNPAMNDASFLRKRTETLLRVTSDSYLCVLDDDGNEIGSSSNCNINSIGAAGGGMKVDKRTFDWLMDAWAFSGELDAHEMAMALLARMEELRDNGGSLRPIRPDVRSYSKVINAISRSGRIDAGEMAEAILDRMEFRCHSEEAEFEAEMGLLNDARPNGYTYTGVIEAYGRSGSPDAAPRAEALVERMETLRAAGDPDVKPTARSWNSVINAWAQSGEIDAAQRAEDCLDRMEELAVLTGNDDVRPNSYNYNSVINAWANANSREVGAAGRAEAILERMERLHREEQDEDVKPRTATYNAIIDAWAKSGDPDAAQRAELLLAHMTDLYESGHNPDAKPNVRSFNSVLNAWAKCRDPEAPLRATDVLQRMEELSSMGGDWEDLSPDATSFSTAINAYARSQVAGKAQEAYGLFQHMVELYEFTGNRNLRPNAVVYNSVLNACAFTMGEMDEQNRAMEIASSMFKGLDASPYGKPDQITYGTYLKVIAYQMPDNVARTRIVEAVFRRCARDGMVGDFVLRMLREVAQDGESFERMTGKIDDEDFSLSDLPIEWTGNVVEGKRMRRQKYRR